MERRSKSEKLDEFLFQILNALELCNDQEEVRKHVRMIMLPLKNRQVDMSKIALELQRYALENHHSNPIALTYISSIMFFLNSFNKALGFLERVEKLQGENLDPITQELLGFTIFNLESCPS